MGDGAELNRKALERLLLKWYARTDYDGEKAAIAAKTIQLLRDFLFSAEERITALESANAKLTAELDQLRADYARQGRENKALRGALKAFVSCAYPVSKYIDRRGHAWRPEKDLDYALALARAALNGETE